MVWTLQKMFYFSWEISILIFFDKRSEHTKKLKSTLKQYGIAQLINKPTRYSELIDSCLDLVCSNSEHIANSVVCNLNLSDHELVLITRKKINIKQEKMSFTGRSYKNYDKVLFTARLLNQDWLVFDSKRDPEILWNTMHCTKYHDLRRSIY